MCEQSHDIMNHIINGRILKKSTTTPACYPRHVANILIYCLNKIFNSMSSAILCMYVRRYEYFKTAFNKIPITLYIFHYMFIYRLPI